MLGLIYIFATAKPISIRRLSLLFVLVLISATLVLVFSRQDAGWRAVNRNLNNVVRLERSAPTHNVRHGKPSRAIIGCASAGFRVCLLDLRIRIAAVAIVTVSAILNPTRGIHLALPRLLVTAAIVALLSTMFIPSLRLPRSRP